MKLNAFSKAMPNAWLPKKIFLVMKLTTFLLIMALLQVSAKGYSQKVSLEATRAPLAKIFAAIEAQTGYVFFYDASVAKQKITLHLSKASLSDALDACFAGCNLSYKIADKTVFIQVKPALTLLDKIETALQPSIDVHGKVVDEKGSPLPGVSITLKGGNKTTITDNNGDFILPDVNDQAQLSISYLGYEPVSIKATANAGTIHMKINSSPLDQVEVIGYGTTSKRLNTGSVSTVTAAEIEKQPVTDVLSALSGRMPGVFVQTTNGLPGGNINIQIRGQNSIRNTPGDNGNYPLYVIDGVPFVSSPIYTNGNGSETVNGPISPFNSINPGDIESISVLKDADATAIYGSRGANGVVLITTKKGKPGATRVNVNISHGISRVANFPDLLNLQQYLEIRREAFKNDGLTPSTDPNAYPNYAPDLTLWSQVASTNWAKFLMGNTSSTTDMQGSISGGSEQDRFLISTNYRGEGSVLLGGGNYQRAGLLVNLSHTSLDKKFSVQFSSTYTGDDNVMANPYGSIMAEVLTAPNFPLYNSDGSLNWSNNVNPLADVKAQSKAQTNNFIANMVMSYMVLPGFNFKVSVGYNRLNSNQVLTNPLSSQNPSYAVSTASYSNGDNQALIVEPQITYTRNFKKSRLDALFGGTYQISTANSENISASNFSSDALIDNAASANTVIVNNNATNYKYESVFARLTYNLDEKYIVNASARRDGSSRFGPGDQFGNFGALGAAWLFSNEKLLKDQFSFLSFGKLRVSYGITGNDQIPDYQYLSTYSSSGYVYQGVSGLQSNQIANADLHWETNKKAELGLDLGFLKDRISLSADFYQNRSSNQLIAYTIPYLTGFSSYQANLPAVVQNTGWEFELNIVNVSTTNFTWKTTFNITLPKNELLSFPGLATSSYANTLAIGKDISQAIGYTFTGVDPKTGAAQYFIPSGAQYPSYDKWGQTSPYFYGGFGNTFTYRSWQLDVFGQFSKQYAKGGLYYTPGLTIQNDFTSALARWQKPGDITNVPKATTNYDPYYSYSTANWFNASYFRLKNISLSYVVPGNWLKRKGIDRLRIYLEGQNLLTIWKKEAALYDPETGGDNSTGNIPIAPMESFVAGLQFTL
jgi:TonB-linked SusC/RagA family outer membrane protein